MLNPSPVSCSVRVVKKEWMILSFAKMGMQKLLLLTIIVRVSARLLARLVASSAITNTLYLKYFGILTIGVLLSLV